MNEPRSMTSRAITTLAVALLALGSHSASADDETGDEAASATLDYNATIANATSGESVSRTRDTAVTGGDKPRQHSITRSVQRQRRWS